MRNQPSRTRARGACEDQLASTHKGRLTSELRISASSKRLQVSEQDLRQRQTRWLHLPRERSPPLACDYSVEVPVSRKSTSDYLRKIEPGGVPVSGSRTQKRV